MVARRDVLKGVISTPLAGLPLAAILADPGLARAAATGLHEYTINTPTGRRVSGALAMPLGAPAPTVLLIHEWWGLNDQIKAITAELGRLGYLAVAVDLMDGRVAKTAEEARTLTGAVVANDAADTLAGWIEWLRVHDASNRKIGVVGWGFGGGWSLAASIESPVEATVVYYGRINRKASELVRLKGPVLGHFANHDKFIDKAMVSAWESEMDKAGKRYTTHWYDADHAFANPTSARYDEADARLAWDRTLKFFDETL
ncbi:MAG: dienelactone hydrolase family protein [Alphaproteobacteria bacterium]|nr:dienelactone hydrolase family protein [Alphaproteobacteria bacterium]